MQENILFNGKTYRSVEDMPPDVRQAYESVMQVLEDKNQNGLPDLFEGALGGQKAIHTSIVYNGQTYGNMADLPPEAREKYDKMMGKWDKDNNGIPDFAEKIAMMGASATPASTIGPAPSRSAFPQSPAIPVAPSAIDIEPEHTGLRFGILAIALLFILCLGGLALWFLFRQLG